MAVPILTAGNFTKRAISGILDKAHGRHQEVTDMNEQKPLVKTPLSRLEIVLEVIAALGLIYGIAMFVLYYPELPETAIGTEGPGDIWYPKNLLLTLLAFNVGIYLLFTVLPRIPRLFRYPARITRENAERMYVMTRKLTLWVKVASVGAWTYAIYFVIRSVPAGTEQVNWLVVSAFIGILLVAVIYYLPRIVRAAK